MPSNRIGRINEEIPPELQFIADDSIQHGAHILEILRQVERQDGDAPDGGASGETEA